MAEFHNIRKRAIALLILLDLEDDEPQQNFPKRRKRNTWVRAWIERRKELGCHHRLVKELELEDEVGYNNFFRMNAQQFWFVVDQVAHRIQKQDTVMRESIRPDERVAVTLRFLATGETFKSLEFSFRISRTAISSIVIETCQAIHQIMGPTNLKTPSSTNEWLAIASRFEYCWNFPNGIGAIDGKRIIIQQPCNSGSHYYDYKGHNSIILMAVFGADYQCLWADVGTNGRAADGTVWQKSILKNSFSSEGNVLNLPPPRALPGRTRQLPYVLTGDDAFGLTKYLMKPYPQSGLDINKRIYNYRLSRMRRIAENGFGIIGNRWRVFRAPILLDPDKVIKITLAALTLHNFLRYVKLN